MINALDSSDAVMVTNNGITVTMTNGMPKVYYKSTIMADADRDYDQNDDHDDGKLYNRATVN